MPEVGPFTPPEWEAWLEAHHETESEAWLVSWKKATGKQALSCAEAVEIAAMFGRPAGMRALEAARFRGQSPGSRGSITT